MQLTTCFTLVVIVLSAEGTIDNFTVLWLSQLKSAAQNLLAQVFIGHFKVLKKNQLIGVHI